MLSFKMSLNLHSTAVKIISAEVRAWWYARKCTLRNTGTFDCLAVAIRRLIFAVSLSIPRIKKKSFVSWNNYEASGFRGSQASCGYRCIITG